MSDERGFDVRDRRRVGRDEPAPEETDPAGAEPEAAEEDEEGPGLFAGLPGVGDLSVQGILSWTAGLLGNSAWVHMGLTAHPLTGKVERNLPEARRAIDALADMVRHLESISPPENRRELQRILTDLRLNFVQQSNRSD